MAVPATPSNFFATQGNGQVFLSWSLTSAATSYTVQKSTDGVTFTTLTTVTTPYYLDTAVTVGVNYYYQVNAVSGDGPSAYTTASNVVPTYSGDMCLGQIRLLAQQRCDRVNSNFVTLPEWNANINQSAFELYDLLVTLYEDMYVAPALQFSTDGASSLYPLPNGSNYSNAAPFYKLLGVDCGLGSSQNGYATLKRFQFQERNRYAYPNTSSPLGVFNLQYRVMGANIEFLPVPSAGQQIRLWYIPRMQMLLQDTDILSGVSGWTEYVIVDAAIKAMQKEESDVSVLAAEKMALKQRIEESASNRDAGEPQAISNTRSRNRVDTWGGN